MRKVLLASAAAVFGLGITAAKADVTVFATIDKTKTITIYEELTVTKNVFLDVDVDLIPDKFAESVALVNQRNENNEGCGNCAEKVDTIGTDGGGAGSGNGNSGILSINLASGNMMNQASAVSASVDVRQVGGGDNGGDVNTDTGFAESMAAAEQINQNSLVRTVDLQFRDGNVIGSLNGNTGVIHANVGPGNMGNQANTLSLAVSFAEFGVALSEADLGQDNLMNTVYESDSIGDGLIGINKAASVQGSINNNAGIVGVSISSGNFANQGNIVSFSAVQYDGV